MSVLMQAEGLCRHYAVGGGLFGVRQFHDPKADCAGRAQLHKPAPGPGLQSGNLLVKTHFLSPIWLPRWLARISLIVRLWT